MDFHGFSWIFDFSIILVRGPAKNVSFEQPDSGKILPVKSDNFHFSVFSGLFPRDQLGAEFITEKRPWISYGQNYQQARPFFWKWKSCVTQIWAGCTEYQPEISILDPIREEKRFPKNLRIMIFHHWSLTDHWSLIIIDHHWSLIIIDHWSWLIIDHHWSSLIIDHEE